MSSCRLRFIILRLHGRPQATGTSRAAKRGGGFQTGGVSRSGLVLPFFVLFGTFFPFCPLFPFFPFFPFFLPFAPFSFLFPSFLSFLGLSRFFWDFPDLSGDSPGIFPIGPFPLSRPIDSTYEEQSRKGPRHNLDLPRKKWETPRFGNPPGLASLKHNRVQTLKSAKTAIT